MGMRNDNRAYPAELVDAVDGLVVDVCETVPEDVGGFVRFIIVVVVVLRGRVSA